MLLAYAILVPTIVYPYIMRVRTNTIVAYDLSSIVYSVTGESRVYFVYGRAIIDTSPSSTQQLG